MRLLILAIILNCSLMCLADSYVKPNYPKRALSQKENKVLQKSCGEDPILNYRQKVWNPRMTNRTEAPWAVAIISARKWSPNITLEEMYNNPNSICSGSLISPRHVLTAAHCIQRNILRALFVIDVQCGVNSTNCHGEPMYLRQAARVFSSIRYAELNPKGNEENGADLAVFELTEDIPVSHDVWPVCLGDDDITVNQKLDLYGYGTHGIANSTFALQHAPVVAAECENKILDQFCSHGPYQKPCGGDSGAGLIYTDNNGRKSVVATHKAGVSCDELNEIAVFGKEGMSLILPSLHTSIQSHLYWICEATGICVNKKIEEDVEIWTKLPNRHRERYVVQEALDEEHIYA